jgi:hypothetical protein
MGPVLFWASLAAAPLPLSAQRQATLGLGTGLVRYPGGSSFSIITASPSLQSFSPFLYLGVGGSASLLEGGVWAGQARTDIWAALTHRASGFRPAVSATLAGSSRSDGEAAGSANGVVETIWSGAGGKGEGGAAAGIGAIAGAIEGVPGVTSLRLRGRGWWTPKASPAQLTLTVEGNRLEGAWYTDVVGGVNYDRNRLVASAWLSGRFSATYGSSGAGSVVLQYYVSPTIAVEGSGGTYLADPYQGLPRAGYFAAGVRLFSTRRAFRTVPPAPPPPVLQPLVAQRRGAELVVRFRMPAARSVAIAGNWNTWRPAPLRAAGDDIWETTLQLAPGVYYFNLVVDGNEWVVPGGVATVPDGMGGLMAVLNVL